MKHLKEEVFLWCCLIIMVTWTGGFIHRTIRDITTDGAPEISYLDNGAGVVTWSGGSQEYYIGSDNRVEFRSTDVD